MQRADMILHSVNAHGNSLETLALRYPKCIHGEMMTHRVFSRNASSSRAIPISKYIEEARSDELRYTPSFSVVNAPGMQGGRETTEEERQMLRNQWRQAAMAAAFNAELMSKWGGAKQDVNRLLEPFIHINVLVTSTEWDNFYGLRLDKDAQPEIQDLARKMWAARKRSAPVPLSPGQWHLPYVTPADEDFAMQACAHMGTKPSEMLINISVARCARVSYANHQTGRPHTFEEDLAMCERLLGRAGALHASPAEHQATPDDLTKINDPLHFGMIDAWGHPNEHGNFVGWRQYRKMIPGEGRAPLPEEFRA